MLFPRARQLLLIDLLLATIRTGTSAAKYSMAESICLSEAHLTDSTKLIIVVDFAVNKGWDCFCSQKILDWFIKMCNNRKPDLQLSDPEFYRYRSNTVCGWSFEVEGSKDWIVRGEMSECLNYASHHLLGYRPEYLQCRYGSPLPFSKSKSMG